MSTNKLYPCFLLFFFYTVLTGSNHAIAYEGRDLNEDVIENLANDPTWLKLLHFKRNRSKILTEDFFLSPAGRYDPKAELVATIHAYSESDPHKKDISPRCKFPARYFWLSQKISLPNYKLHEPQCESFEKWSLLNDVKSMSLFLVSGYFGNPASVFGHSFLKLNTYSRDDKDGLFDLSINYGALVPENEPTLQYVVRGITGGYQAGFSDKYFYTHDLVYSRTEFRDIWEYELLLSDYQRNLLILHIWEVLGRKFDYYFLDENCAFRLAELLEIIIEEPFLDQAKKWYIPVETFFRLEEIDKNRRAKGDQGLIKLVCFHPSSQREFYYQFAQLTKREKEAVKTIINDVSSTSSITSSFQQHSRLRIIDTVLSYYKYRLIAEEPSPSVEMREKKNEILLARLRLPPQTKSLFYGIPQLKSPARGNRPMLMGIGMGLDSTESTYFKLHWSPFSQEIVGQNHLEGDELVVLDTTIGFRASDYGFFVDNFDLVRIRKLKKNSLSIDDGNPWSWQLRLGTTLTEHNNKSYNDGIFSFGAGRAWSLNESISFYAMVDTAAHTIKPYARLRPNTGIITDNDSIKSWWYAGFENMKYSEKFDFVWGSQIQYKISEQMAVSISFSSETTTKIAAEVKWYW
ncbi:DUF4105 domain-containing protein [Desulforhopalus vacuolatus]|uniref:Lnb N-terminal periplasmic domain-containing protein n=1 Tax=Desulforhopalus vacuolatus TaxID=40414 RepID=UPI001963735E|nr:DUF4105 domain-containing protein [Desulforhopalus vacuolatus]MBM9520726.1 DUF4105 domain-containing protein [Desulforhopalus vacuolatus]